MYTAKGNQVFANDELFLTVHETEPVKAGVITIEQQAELVAKFLNEAVSL